MQYVLITAKDRRLYFCIKEAAELYKVLYGGYVVHVDELLELAA